MTFAPEHFRDYIGDAIGAGLDPESLAVVVVMRFHADEDGRVALTVEQIAEDAKVSRRTTMDRLAQLVARQIVEREVTSKRGNVYQLRPIQKCAPCTSEVQRAHIRSAWRAHQKCTRRTSEVQGAHIRSAAGALPNHICSYSGSDLTTELQEQEQQAAAAARASAPAHVREDEPKAPSLPVEPAVTAVTADLESIVRDWMATQNGRSPDRQAAIAPWATTTAIAALLAKHGPEKLRAAIKAAALKTNQGAPSLAFLTRLLDEGVYDGPRPQKTAAYVSKNGVATPRHVPEGEI